MCIWKIIGNGNGIQVTSLHNILNSQIQKI